MAEEVLLSKPKRTRVARVASKITTRKGQFVCDYTNMFVDKAVFVPGFRDVCFRNIPCAVAFVELSSENEQDADKALTALADHYGQTKEQLVRAPSAKLLSNNGGTLDYADWIGELHNWDLITEQSGLTVDQWKRSDTRKPKKAKAVAIVYEPGVYLIKPGKGTGLRVNALEGALQKGVKGQLTSVSVVRKLDKWLASNDRDETYASVNANADGVHVIGATPYSGCEGDAKEVNAVGSKISGHVLYGPAMFTFTRKFSLKPE